MKRLTVVASMVATLGLALGLTGVARATEVGLRRPLGLGFAIGSPTSIVGKYFLNSENALDFGLSFWRYRNGCYDRNGQLYCDTFGRMGIGGDYLWQEPLALGTAKLDWHIGAGARLWVFDDYYNHGTALEARMPIGLDLTFARPPFLEVFVEAAPAIYLVPFYDSGLDFEALIGARFYF